MTIVLPRAQDVPDGMIYVPAGRFLYGVGSDEATRAWAVHQPLHAIELPAFLISRTETTYAEYLPYLRALPAAQRPARSHITFEADGRAVQTNRGLVTREGEPVCETDGSCTELSQLPVAFVTPDEAVAYAGWLERSRGISGAHLCTDREWERAVRGADDRLFTTGNSMFRPGEVCPRTGPHEPGTRPRPCPVLTHPAARSLFGVEDAAGSLWEMSGTPLDIASPQTIIARGGSWGSGGLDLMVATRNFVEGGLHSLKYGFRICAKLP